MLHPVSLKPYATVLVSVHAPATSQFVRCDCCALIIIIYIANRFSQCNEPFVGDGFSCTIDTDGDEYPDVILDSCNPGNQNKYCQKVSFDDIMLYICFQAHATHLHNYVKHLKRCYYLF